MIIDKGIPIKNVYYMLTYAFKELKRNNYEQIAGETLRIFTTCSRKSSPSVLPIS